MSFIYEDIDDEVYMKMAEQAEGKDYIWVTPKELPPNYPIKDQIPQACCLSYRYKKVAEEIKNFEVFPDDVWLVTYPKSGTTWSQEMVYLIKNNLDYEKALRTSLTMRFPFIEFNGIRDMPDDSLIDIAKNLSRPRTIKSHLPMQLLPDQIWTVNPKIIYVFRNPKDVVVSYFHHSQTLHGYLGGMKDFVDCFVNEFLMWSPYHFHISSALELSEVKKNICLLKYEDMKKDLRKEILKIANFLETEINENDLLKLIDHLSLENMKKNPSVNLEMEIKGILAATNRANENNDNLCFIRKGQVGGWKSELTPEMAQQIDEWSNKKQKDNKFLQKYL